MRSLWERFLPPRWERYGFDETAKSRREQAIVIEALQPWLAGSVLLDVGCGAGRLYAHIHGARYIGLEYGGVIKVARQQLLGVPLINASASALPIRSQGVDLAVAQGVLELIEDWRGALTELLRVARRAVLVTLRVHSSSHHYREQILGVGWVTCYLVSAGDVKACVQGWHVREVPCGNRTLFVLQRSS